MPISTGNEAWKCRQLEVINPEESPHICCPCRLGYSHTHTNSPAPGCWGRFPTLRESRGTVVVPPKTSSIPTSAQKIYFPCVHTKCRKIPQHGRNVTEEILLFFTDYLTSVKHRAQSPMSCTYWTMNFSEKYYLTAKIIKPAWQPVSRGNINLSSSFRSSSVTDNAGKTRGLFSQVFMWIVTEPDVANVNSTK